VTGRIYAVKYQAQIDTARLKRPEGVHVSCEPQVGELLYALVRLKQPVVAVEIGVFLGFSGFYICSALAANGSGKLYAIDGQDYKSGIGELPECEFRQGDSRLLVPHLPMLDFAFVDGDHSYAGTKADFENLRPKLNPGALLVFHDAYSYDDVGKVVAELPPEFERVLLPTPILPERALAYGKPSGVAVVRYA
jgi:predicted O-methyltransferase YrrM